MNMNHGIHRIHGILTLAVVGTLLGGATNAATVTATTDAFRLSIKHDGIRQSAGDETLTYSSKWDGGDGATVTIAQDGAALVEGLTGEGERAWSVTRNGTYVLTHTTYTNGVAGKVESATFVVTGKDVPFADGDVTVSNYSMMEGAFIFILPFIFLFTTQQVYQILPQIFTQLVNSAEEARRAM